ncbi:alpha/beta hydrolase [Teredinibacter sp. KSP-S5-2]|uniref:alpha/beta fold hydrolase n=1 Tax=Teredinibacter sp. KSP-S5-2 TaxID=3034506 RepID=UPI0029350CF9|nr:alpha/beta hydrolase [Teredinibacter sp. KSP-S5-2]WNO10706.1 alpha/beta hydrolase [Teredinibacter sp. KSP-S5-2]
MKSYTKSIQGIETEFLVSEGAGDPVFFFHGNSSGADAYTDLLQSEVGEKYQLVSVSLPGHGKTDLPEQYRQEFSIADIGAFTVDVIKDYNPDRYLLVGQSLGGHALLESLPQHTKAAGLCLISAPPFSLNTIGDAFLEDPTGGLLFQNVLTDDEVKTFARAFVSHDSAESMLSLMQSIRETDGVFRSALGQSLANGKVLDEIQLLKEFKRPTWILQGLEDQFIAKDYYQALAGYGLSVELKPFVNTGHAIQLDSAVLFATTIEHFILRCFSSNDESMQPNVEVEYEH